MTAKEFAAKIRKRWQELPRCTQPGCIGKKPGGAPTGLPRPVYADGLCYEHYQEELTRARAQRSTP